MKTIFSVTIPIFFISVMTACNVNTNTPAPETHTIDQTTPAEQQDVKESPSTAKPGTAKEGDIVERDGVKVKVVTKKELNQSFQMGPLEVIIADVQVIDVLDVHDPSDTYLLDYVEGEPYRYIRIDYAVKNPSKDNYNFGQPIETIVLNTGEQIDAVFDNLLVDEIGGEFYSNSHKNDLAMVIPFKSSPEKVTSFRIITGSVSDLDMNEVVEPKEVSIKLK